MKSLTDIIIFSLCVVSFVIAVHQTMVFGIGYSYFIFMLSIGLLFLYKYRKAKASEKEEKKANKKHQKKR